MSILTRICSRTAAAAAICLTSLAGPALATDIQRIVTPGGIEAWLVEEHAIPIVSIEIGFKGGATLEAPEEAGISTLMMGMLEEGAGDRDAITFAKAVEETAARLGFSASRDTVRVSATVLSERRDESLELLRDALLSPRFDAEPLARVKAQMISGIRQKETDPSSLASTTFFKAMFPDDPYGRDRDGTVETVTSFTAEALREAMPRFMNKQHMKVGVVGDITADELGPVLDRLLGDLPESGPALPGPVEPVVDGEILVVDFDAPQSEVLYGHLGLVRDDPDFIPAYVMNYILGGGGFASRLTVEVREKRGLAYGVYSYLAPLDRAPLYLGGVATANERVAESIDVIKGEWRRMAESGVSADELDRAKRYLTGAFPLRFDSNGKIANYLVGAQLDEMPIDYIDTRNGLVEAVTVADIQRIAARLLKEDELRFVVVGKPEGLTASQ